MTKSKMLEILNRRAVPGSGIYLHQYKFASDDAPAFLADECGYHGVETQFAAEKMDADEIFYLFSYNNYDAGLDPWVKIDGGIRRLDADSPFGWKYTLHSKQVGELCVQNDTRIFASSKAILKALGIISGTLEQCP